MRVRGMVGLLGAGTGAKALAAAAGLDSGTLGGAALPGAGVAAAVALFALAVGVAVVVARRQSASGTGTAKAGAMAPGPQEHSARGGLASRFGQAIRLGSAERRLRSDPTYRTLFDSSAAGLLVTDAEMRIMLANGKAAAMIGLSRDLLVGRNYLDFAHPSERERLKAMQVTHNSGTARELPCEFEVRYCDAHGNEGWCLVSVAPVPGTRTAIATLIDITARKRAEDALRQAAVVYENTGDGVLIADTDGVIIGVNQAFTRITGYELDEARGRTPAILRSGRHDAAFYADMWRRIRDGDTWQGEIWNRRKSGEIYPEWLTINGVRDADGRIANYVAVFSDVAQLKRSATQLYHLAHYDALTDLPNRAYFQSQVEHALAAARRHARTLGLLFIDVDRFKNINDSLGHAVGDELLRAVAQRLRSRLRLEDTLARLGGDEFAVLLESIESVQGAATVAQSLIDEMAAPFLLAAGREVYVSISVGIASYPGSEPEMAQLIRDADTAMYAAKEAGRGTFRMYSENLTRQARERLDLEAALRRALAGGQFAVDYQPRLCTATDRVVGFEALVRWGSSAGNMVPSGFLSVAEETGLIVPIGEWVIRTACRQAAEWFGSDARGCRMAVNLSPRQLRQPDLVAFFGRVLRETGLAADTLELEISESAIAERRDAAAATLRGLKALGLRIVIDDFGTGGSSLSALKRFPIDAFKIDRSFVAGLGSDGDDREIVAAIIALGRNLGVMVMAEGVDTEEQHDFLVAHGCVHAQGLYHAPPLAATEAGRWLSRAEDADTPPGAA